MLGTFGGALEARKIDASGGRLSAYVRGEIETEDGVLVIRRVHILFTLHAPADTAAVVERVHSFFADKCPIYQSLNRSIQITSSFTIV
jgi:uncharacterized OsmC-like protein